MKKKKLFEDCIGGTDKKFYCLCKSLHYRHKEIREFCEKLWSTFVDYADKHFLTEIKNDFTTRFWEMYLYNAFLEKGKQAINLNSKKGPDLLFNEKNITIWVEAVCPQNGSKKNEVDKILYNKMQEIPEDKIILRLLTALSDKVKKYNDYLGSNIVHTSDCCIIALNGTRINMNDTPVNIFKALFNIGGFYVRNEDFYFETKEQVIKNDTTTIEKFFSSETNKMISAILYSNAYATDNEKELGYDFYLILNPNALNPLPKSFYNWNIVTEDNVLNHIR